MKKKAAVSISRNDLRKYEFSNCQKKVAFELTFP